MTGSATMGQYAHRSLDWVTTDRVRLFGVSAAALAFVSLILLLLGSWVSAVLGVLVALVATACALLAVATWLASRRGTTDGHDLWDRGDSPASRPEDVFDGFSGFHE